MLSLEASTIRTAGNLVRDYATCRRDRPGSMQALFRQTSHCSPSRGTPGMDSMATAPPSRRLTNSAMSSLAARTRALDRRRGARDLRTRGAHGPRRPDLRFAFKGSHRALKEGAERWFQPVHGPASDSRRAFHSAGSSQSANRAEQPERLAKRRCRGRQARQQRQGAVVTPSGSRRLWSMPSATSRSCVRDAGASTSNGHRRDDRIPSTTPTSKPSG